MLAPPPWASWCIWCFCRRCLLIEMAYLVFLLVYSFDWYGIFVALIGVLVVFVWHIYLLGWHVQNGPFRVLCGKKYASWKKVHQRCWWCWRGWWQIIAMFILIFLSNPHLRSIFGTKSYHLMGYCLYSEVRCTEQMIRLVVHIGCSDYHLVGLALSCNGRAHIGPPGSKCLQ